MKEKIKQLLGLNLPAPIIASAVGCAHESIVDLLADPVFAAEVQALRTLRLAEGAGRDSKYDQLEDALLDKLRELVDSGLFGASNPYAIAKVLQILNTAKRRTTPAELSTGTQRTVVPIILPITIAAKFVVNAKNQVTEVEGRVVATMPAAAVVKQLEAKQKRDGVEQQNTEEHLKDEARARERLDALVKLTHLPVHALV